MDEKAHVPHAAVASGARKRDPNEIMLDLVRALACEAAAEEDARLHAEEQSRAAPSKPDRSMKSARSPKR